MTNLPHCVVVKLGTSTLTDGSTHLSLPTMVALVRQMDALHRLGVRVALVSSGAMAAGREVLDYPALPRSVPAKQMLSAVGQPRLMAQWAQLFGLYGLTVAQVLLTRADLTHRRRYLNARNTLMALFDSGVIPVINENDTVATEEIRLGDNDTLSALVANLIDADLLMLLTDQQGLFDKDPRKHPDARLIARVDEDGIGPVLWAMAGKSGKLGVGGMQTKLQAADVARRSGTAVVITHGKQPDVILRVARGEPLGTYFSVTATAIESRKRYIVSGLGNGALTVDAGAARALRRQRSLLPAGVTRVDGEFERGETVRVLGPDGAELARGLAGYCADDCRKLVGRQSREIADVLGYSYGDTIMHKDNLVLTGNGQAGRRDGQQA